MNKEKNVMLFGNKELLKSTNAMIRVGIGAIILGVVTLVVGERRFYKNVKGFQSDNPESTVINNIFNDFSKMANE